MVIGGQAVLLYGEPRQTKDIDVTMGIGPERVNDVLDIVSSVGWTVLPESPKEFVARTLVLPCVDDASGVRIDFVFSFSPYEQLALSRARRVGVEGTEVNYVSVEDLIILKVVAGRPRDLEDVRTVLVKNPTADVTEIRRCLGEFEQALAEPFLKRFEGILTRPPQK